MVKLSKEELAQQEFEQVLDRAAKQVVKELLDAKLRIEFHKYGRRVLEDEIVEPEKTACQVLAEAFNNIDDHLTGSLPRKQVRQLLMQDVPWELDEAEVEHLLDSIPGTKGNVNWIDLKKATVGNDEESMEPHKLAALLFDLRFSKFIDTEGLTSLYSPRSWRLKLKPDLEGAGVFDEEEEEAEEEFDEGDLDLGDDDDKKGKKDKKDKKEKKGGKDDKKDKKDKKEKGDKKDKKDKKEKSDKKDKKDKKKK